MGKVKVYVNIYLQTISYLSLIGAHIMNTITGTAMNSVQRVCLYMHDLREPHFSTLKQILRYARGTMSTNASRFSVEAEYRGVANVVAETCWLRIYYHQQTKHI
nr:hypothetical protein [Tanacetum cinerariifolium]